MADATDEQIASVTTWLPSSEADPDVWDATKIAERWTGGIAGTIRAYWYQRVSDTAGYLDVPDPGGTLPITQIHRQAVEMLKYWDEFLTKWGANADPSVVGGATKIGSIKRRYQRQGTYPINRFDYRSPYTRT